MKVQPSSLVPCGKHRVCFSGFGVLVFCSPTTLEISPILFIVRDLANLFNYAGPAWSIAPRQEFGALENF